MPYSRKSRQELLTCSLRLIQLFNKVDALGFECTVVEGHRNQAKQNWYYELDKSKVQWPDGKHNTIPSEAVDVAPYLNGDVSWDKSHCIYFAGVVNGIAATLGVKIRWGGNWDMDAEVITDQDFQDLVHFEQV